MFLKRVFLSMIVFSGAVSLSYGYAPDKIDLSFSNAETQIISCKNCPIPGKECRSYIVTSTNKFCLSSGEERQDKDVGTDNRVMPVQSDDLTSLQENLNNQKDNNSEPLQEAEDDMTLEQEPSVIEEN